MLFEKRRLLKFLMHCLQTQIHHLQQGGSHFVGMKLNIGDLPQGGQPILSEQFAARLGLIGAQLLNAAGHIPLRQRMLDQLKLHRIQNIRYGHRAFHKQSTKLYRFPNSLSRLSAMTRRPSHPAVVA